MMENERELELKQLFVYYKKNIVYIIVFTMICTLALAGHNFKNQKAIIGSPVAVNRAGINTIIEQNRKAYYSVSADPKPFTYAEPPANTFNSNAKLLIDYNYNELDEKSVYDYSQIINKAQNDAVQILVSDSALERVIEELDLRSYDDMSNLSTSELRWLISTRYDGVSVMQVIVSDVDNERAKLIADAVIDEFVNHATQYSLIESVEVIDYPSAPERYSPLYTVQTNLNKKSILKNAIIGFAGGLFVALLWLLFLFVFKDVIRCKEDIEYSGINCIGVISKNGKKRIEDCKRLAYKMMIQEEQIFAIVPTDKRSEKYDVESIVEEELNQLGKNVLLICEEDLKSTIDKINNNKEKKEIIIVKTQNITDYADVLLIVQKCDVVITKSAYNKTRFSDVENSVDELKKINANIDGSILCN